MEEYVFRRGASAAWTEPGAGPEEEGDRGAHCHKQEEEAKKGHWAGWHLRANLADKIDLVHVERKPSEGIIIFA